MRSAHPTRAAPRQQHFIIVGKLKTIRASWNLIWISAASHTATRNIKQKRSQEASHVSWLRQQAKVWLQWNEHFSMPSAGTRASGSWATTMFDSKPFHLHSLDSHYHAFANFLDKFSPPLRFVICATSSKKRWGKISVFDIIILHFPEADVGASIKLRHNSVEYINNKMSKNRRNEHSCKLYDVVLVILW